MATDGVVIDSNKLVIDQFIFDLGLVDRVNDTQPEDQAYVDADDGVYQSEVVLLLQILLIFRRAGHLGKENWVISENRWNDTAYKYRVIL